MQSTTFVGNLTRDPELRHSRDGNPRATFSLAINEGQGDNERTHFINFTAFGTLGENVAKSLRKGQRLVVTGRLDTYKKAVEIDGDARELTMTNFIASAVGPDLRWATAEVSKVARPASNDDDDEARPKAKAEPKAQARRGRTAKPEPQEDDDEF